MGINYQCWRILLFLATVFTQPLLAVQLNVRHYDTRNGLPQVQVLTVQRCDHGYLWLGTFSGLSRYNGSHFRHFYTADGLRSNYITDLATDRQGRLWVGTSAGVCRLVDDNRFACPEHSRLVDAHIHALHAAASGLWVASDTGLFRVFDAEVERITLPDPISGAAVFSVTTDDSGRVWFGTATGLYTLAPDLGTFDGPIPGSSHLEVTALTAVSDGVWVGTNQGLYRWSGSELEPLARPAWLTELDIEHLFADKANRLWAATATGLVRFQGGRFERLTTRNRLASDMVRQTHVDREGIVWLAHDTGLSKMLPNEFTGYTVDSGLVDSFVRSMAEDERGRLWLGTRSGVQILQLRDDEWQIEGSKTITITDGLPDERIYSITFPTPGEALLATSQGIVHWHEREGILKVYQESDGLPTSRSRALLKDSKGRIWASTQLGTVFLRDGQVVPLDIPALDTTYAMRMLEDHSGRIWFATLQQGLISLDTQGEVRQLRKRNGLSDEMLWDLALAGDDSIWVGSNGDGLFRIDAEGTITQYTADDGLADNFVWQVLVDAEGNVWGYTNHGLSKFDGKTFENYTEADGLLHLEGAATAALQTSNGDLWFGSAEGLMRHTPEKNQRIDLPPPVVIESVQIGSQEIVPGQQLPYRPGSLHIEFAGLSFHDEDAVTFRYRLSGIETDWTDGGTTRSVTYAGLGGGQYRFEVQARNSQGIWSRETAKFPFRVRPPFWATWWFWALVLLAGALLARSALMVRERTMRARQRELQQIVAQQTTELREANRRLERASRTDTLTGLPNRRYLLDRIDHDIAESRRSYANPNGGENRDMIFMMIDLDHFKSINDRYGHDAGDQVLRNQARLIANELRAADDLIRWGGEEFLVVARHAEAGLASVIADRIVRASRSQSVMLGQSETIAVPTCSVGIATYPFFPDHPELFDWEQVVQLADHAVYMAKAKGRDGWVWLRPGDKVPSGDADTIINQVRRDGTHMMAEGYLQTETSFES